MYVLTPTVPDFGQLIIQYVPRYEHIAQRHSGLGKAGCYARHDHSPGATASNRGPRNALRGPASLLAYFHHGDGKGADPILTLKFAYPVQACSLRVLQ